MPQTGRDDGAPEEPSPPETPADNVDETPAQPDAAPAEAEAAPAAPVPWRRVQAGLFAAMVLLAFVAAGEVGPLPGWLGALLFAVGAGAWVGLGPRLDGHPWLQRADEDPFAGDRRWALLAAWFGVRAPLLFSGGYSSDLDSWRVAVVARRLIEQGDYEPSRWPGYPVVEILLAPVVRFGGAVGANLTTSIIGFVGLFLFDRLGRRLGLRAMGLATWALALSAPVVVNTASTVDYPWALTALLGALLASTHRRWALAGVLLGVATGCRLPMGTYGLPILLLALKEPDAPRATRDLCLATAGTAALVLSPLWLQYGLGFLHAYGQTATLASGSIRVVWGLGVFTLLGSAAVVVDAIKGLGPEPLEAAIDRRSADHILLTLFWMVVGWYVALTVQGAYLFPLVPFGLFLAARWARPTAVAALGLAMAVANVWDIRPGFIPEELRARAEDRQPSEAVDALDLPDGATLIIGVSYPVVRALHPDWEVEPAAAWRDELLSDPSTGLQVALDLDEADLKARIAEGPGVWIFDDGVVKDWTKRHKTDPLALGAQVLSAEQRGDVRTPHRDDGGKVRPKREKGEGKGKKRKAEAAEAAEATEQTTEATEAPSGPSEWSSSAPDATKLKQTEGRVVIELARKDDKVVEVCQRPATPASGSMRARTRWKVKKLEPSGEVAFVAVWLKGGAEISRETVGSLSAVSTDADLNQALNPPEGADAVMACVTLSPRRAIVTLSRTKIKAGD